MFALPFRTPRVTGLVAPLVGAGALAVVVGCQLTPPVPAPPTQTDRIVEIDAADYAFNAPETLAGGLVTIRLINHGQEPHHAQLLRLNDGVSFEQFTAAMQQEGERALRLTSGAGGPGTTDPHGTTEVTLDLKPGTYALACFIAGPDGIPHLMKGMLKPIQVSEPVVAQLPPTVQDTFTMKDFSFNMPASLPVGRATYRVLNYGPQMHELNIIKLASGKSVDDVVKWFNTPDGPPPFSSAGGINAFSSDGSGYMTLDLQPGDYLAVCNVPDLASGVPHSHLGMLKQFTVNA